LGGVSVGRQQATIRDGGKTMAVFRLEIFWENISVALSLLFDKIYPTMN
jgi:hypothetical protein